MAAPKILQEVDIPAIQTDNSVSPEWNSFGVCGHGTPLGLPCYGCASINAELYRRLREEQPNNIEMDNAA